MSTEESVTDWMRLLEEGDHASAQPLWERYFPRLVRLARQKLYGRSNGIADEEDIALSAFDSFCRGAEQGRFPRLDDRESLWRLLVCITARKACDRHRHDNRKKRGGESGKTPDLNFHELDQIVGNEPTPEFAAQVAEEYLYLLELLSSDELRQVAVWKMEGFTIKEIATKLDCTLRTVQRRLDVIRSTWKQEERS